MASKSSCEDLDTCKLFLGFHGNALDKHLSKLHVALNRKVALGHSLQVALALSTSNAEAQVSSRCHATQYI